MHRALLNFDHLADGGFRVHFIEADCRTTIGAKTRYHTLPSVDELRAFVIRSNVEDIAEFELNVRAWGRGSVYVQLTPAQYSLLR